MIKLAANIVRNRTVKIRIICCFSRPGEGEQIVRRYETPISVIAAYDTRGENADVMCAVFDCFVGMKLVRENQNGLACGKCVGSAVDHDFCRASGLQIQFECTMNVGYERKILSGKNAEFFLIK